MGWFDKRKQCWLAYECLEREIGVGVSFSTRLPQPPCWQQPILGVKPLQAFQVELRLTNGEVVQRDLLHLLSGPVFEGIRSDEEMFRQVRAEGGASFGRVGWTIARMR